MEVTDAAKERWPKRLKGALRLGGPGLYEATDRGTDEIVGTGRPRYGDRQLVSDD